MPASRKSARTSKACARRSSSRGPIRRRPSPLRTVRAKPPRSCRLRRKNSPTRPPSATRTPSVKAVSPWQRRTSPGRRLHMTRRRQPPMRCGPKSRLPPPRSLFLRLPSRRMKRPSARPSPRRRSLVQPSSPSPVSWNAARLPSPRSPRRRTLSGLPSVPPGRNRANSRLSFGP